MSKKKSQSPDSALKVNEGVEKPNVINPNAAARFAKKKAAIQPVQEYVDAILKGDRVMLSKAITLNESTLPTHQETGQKVIEACLPGSGNSIRVGITGVPGVGKSTFIEAMGIHLINKGHKVAVLAIDPSSQRTKGSILGDKTRMEDLANHPDAFIRPSSSSGTLGGVARRTRESIILCEAAGYDIIFIETVGVGQSETHVHGMVDFFLLLMLAGAGDELQGIKRGIMEMADAIIINKADGDNKQKAELAKREYANALHLFPATESGWQPKVETCSAIEKNRMMEVWRMVEDYILLTKRNTYFQQNRRKQAIDLFYETIEEQIKSRFYSDPAIKKFLPVFEKNILEQKLSSYAAASEILRNYLKP